MKEYSDDTLIEFLNSLLLRNSYHNHIANYICNVTFDIVTKSLVVKYKYSYISDTNFNSYEYHTFYERDIEKFIVEKRNKSIEEILNK